MQWDRPAAFNPGLTASSAGRLLSDIVLTGSNAIYPGMPCRLQAEIQALVTPAQRSQVRVTAASPDAAPYSVWLGGSILASLSTFKGKCWEKWNYDAYDEGGTIMYDEYGPTAVHRNCSSFELYPGLDDFPELSAQAELDADVARVASAF
jgi:hypothetical protein